MDLLLLIFLLLILLVVLVAMVLQHLLQIRRPLADIEDFDVRLLGRVF